MSFFPINTELNNQITNKKISINKNGKSFLFDFNKGDFIAKDGKLQVIEEIDAIITWINKVIYTEKFRFKIYEEENKKEYGVSLYKLLTKEYKKFFIYSEIKREITEALLKNIEIKNVNNFSFEREKRTLIVSFNVETIYGSHEIEVNLDGRS